MASFISFIILAVFLLTPDCSGVSLKAPCPNPVNCFADPCMMAGPCKAYPNAQCVSNMCEGKCDAQFFLKGQRVDCNAKRGNVVAPTTTKYSQPVARRVAGVCPPPPPGNMLAGVCAEMCDNCEAKGQLCCSNGCGHVCMTPITKNQYASLTTTVKSSKRVSGVCPPVPQISFTGGRVGMCAETCNNCEARGQLCCSNGCGHSCMTPVNVVTPPIATFKPPIKVAGVCPTVPPIYFSPPMDGSVAGGGMCAEACNNCEAKGQLCCFNGCGHSCMAPVKKNLRTTVKPPKKVAGVCPPEPQVSFMRAGVGRCVETCNNCEAKGQLCCSTGCGHMCMDPLSTATVKPPQIVSGVCPPMPAINFARPMDGSVVGGGMCAETCNNCEAKGQLCCFNGCGRSCMAPVRGNQKATVKPPPQKVVGVCPILNTFMAGPCVEMCDNCEAKGQLCCSNGCGHSCMAPVDPTINNPIPKPLGVCPPIRSDLAGICVEMCDNCEAKGQLCCSNGCGHTCTDPVNYGDVDLPLILVDSPMQIDGSMGPD